jgi:hypothetical protein
MRFKASLGVIAAAAAAMTLAHTSVAAQQQLQLAAGSWQAMGADDLSFKGALSTFTASNLLTAALNSTGAQVSQVRPGQAAIITSFRGKYTSISLGMPVTTLDGLYQNRSFNINGVQTSGGLSIITEDDEITNTGGSLTMSNLRVDLDDKKIYADVAGANGVGLQQQVHLWTYTNGRNTPSFGTPPLCQFWCLTDVKPDISLTGLVIQQPAFDLFTRSLGLTQDGMSSLSRVTDYGTLVVAVPEASTVVQMGLGLACLGALATRRRAHAISGMGLTAP